MTSLGVRAPAAFTFGVVEPARADVAGLTPCAESKAFQKRQKKSVKDLTKRQAKVGRWGGRGLCFRACRSPMARS